MFNKRDIIASNKDMYIMKKVLTHQTKYYSVKRQGNRMGRKCVLNIKKMQQILPDLTYGKETLRSIINNNPKLTKKSGLK